jgi:hypothetical protein
MPKAQTRKTPPATKKAPVGKATKKEPISPGSAIRQDLATLPVHSDKPPQEQIHAYFATEKVEYVDHRTGKTQPGRRMDACMAALYDLAVNSTSDDHRLRALSLIFTYTTPKPAETLNMTIENGQYLEEVDQTAAQAWVDHDKQLTAARKKMARTKKAGK